MAQIARLVRIRGRVQGVFFRAWTRDQAQRLGVAGWVRNCPDGSVEAHLEGEEASVEKMVVRLREGPPHAQVMAIEVTEGELENLSAFKVQH